MMEIKHFLLSLLLLSVGMITLVWVRHDTTAVLPWLNAKSDLFYSVSTDGQYWSVPSQITNEAGNVVNLFPAIYPKLDDEWSLVWLSNKPGHPVLFELPLANVDVYPLGRVKNRRLRVGYSHLCEASHCIVMRSAP